MNAAHFLKQHVGVFNTFTDESLKQLVGGSRLASFEAKESVAHQGEEATHFGVVLSGTVAASAIGEGGTRQSLGQLNAGDTFGEAALMTGDPLLADFIAESRCEVLLIPVSLFQSVIVAEPGAVQQISRTIAKRMKTILADPSKAAVLRQGGDPYGLRLKGERLEKILTVNCGSSSLKYSFYDTTDESHHARGLVERIGIDGTRLAHLRRNMFMVNPAERFAIETHRTQHDYSADAPWVRLSDQTSGDIVLEARMTSANIIHITAGKFYSHTHEVVEITPHYCRIGSGMTLFGDIREARGGPVVLG